VVVIVTIPGIVVITVIVALIVIVPAALSAIAFASARER
jgi:hypothetical protein